MYAGQVFSFYYTPIFKLRRIIADQAGQQLTSLSTSKALAFFIDSPAIYIVTVAAIKYGRVCSIAAASIFLSCARQKKRPREEAKHG